MRPMRVSSSAATTPPFTPARRIVLQAGLNMSLPKLPASAAYAVSAITLECPLSSPIQQRSGKPYTYQDAGSTKPLLSADTVLLNIYYPTDKTKATSVGNGSVNWLDSPKLQSIGGLLKYAGISKYLAVPILIPAYRVVYSKLPVDLDAPLALNSDAAFKFPVAVFSHGMGGSRTAYSAYCSALASSGIVVAAIEHRDGSAAFTTIHHPASTDVKSGSGMFSWMSGSASAHLEPKMYVKPTEIDGTPAAMEVRSAQVEMRQQEVLAALSVLQQIASGGGADLMEKCTRSSREHAQVRAHRSKVLAAFEGKLDVKLPWLIGHSFGGSTAIQTLRQSDCPFGQALVLDPWVEPIPILGPEVPPVSKPLYIINSEDFTQWTSHMKDVTQISTLSRQSTAGKGWLVTIGAEGTEKSDASTAPALAPAPPSRLVVVHDMFGTLFGLDACIDALVSLFPDQLKNDTALPSIVPELVIMDWFHATQRDFTYSSVSGAYVPIAQVFKGTLPRVLLQAGILPGLYEGGKPLTKAGSYLDNTPAEQAMQDPFDPSVTETMMGALKKLRPRPGMVEALTNVYRDRDSKKRLPPHISKVDVWAATNGSLELGRASFLRALGDIDGSDLDSDSAKEHRSDQEVKVGCGIGLFSCDEISVAKPDPKVYAEILRRIKAQPIDPNASVKEYQGIWFVASHTWDTAAAKRAGFKTAWVTYEEHYHCPSVFGTPDIVGRNMEEIAEKILAYEREHAPKDAAEPQPWSYSKQDQIPDTLVGSQHTSFSDFPFLLPTMSKFVGSVPTQAILDVNSQITQRMILHNKREESEGVFDGLPHDWRAWVEGQSRPPPLSPDTFKDEKVRTGRLVVHATARL